MPLRRKHNNEKHMISLQFTAECAETAEPFTMRFCLCSLCTPWGSRDFSERSQIQWHIGKDRVMCYGFFCMMESCFDHSKPGEVAQ